MTKKWKATDWLKRGDINLRVLEASWHRNGVGGAGFFAVLFEEKEQGRMLAALFDEPAYCAVFHLGELAKENITFGYGNSWRGDSYEAALRPAVEQWQELNGSNRIGPFSIPVLHLEAEADDDNQ
ncbi:MAG: hypothetical protein L0Z53_09040 [Acidobacteriales bacterium]|nr:hypothetical protein [Terriglobales bacterium]